MAGRSRVFASRTVPAQPPRGMSGKSGSVTPFLTRTTVPAGNRGGAAGCFVRGGRFLRFLRDTASSWKEERSRYSMYESPVGFGKRPEGTEERRSDHPAASLARCPLRVA